MKYVVLFRYRGKSLEEFLTFKTVLEAELWLSSQHREVAEGARVYQQVETKYVPASFMVSSR